MTSSYKKCAACPRRIKSNYTWCFLCYKLYSPASRRQLPKACVTCSAPSSKPLCSRCFKASAGHHRGRLLERLQSIDEALAPPPKNLPPPNPLRKIWR